MATIASAPMTGRAFDRVLDLVADRVLGLLVGVCRCMRPSPREVVAVREDR